MWSNLGKYLNLSKLEKMKIKITYFIIAKIALNFYMENLLNNLKIDYNLIVKIKIKLNILLLI